MTSFSDAVEVQVGSETACARKTDGSVWCWGTNATSELGVPSATLFSSYYAVQVQMPGTGLAQKVSRFMSQPEADYCAIMADSSVVCWGYDQHLEAGVPAAGYVAPTRVLTSSGGAPLMDVIYVTQAGTGTGGATCAQTSSFDVKCWGWLGATHSAYPFGYLDQQSEDISLIQQPMAGSYGGFAYLDPSGVVNFNGAPMAVQPPCGP
jgi:alpha-tubulin suppressor-like RCC1 family protein